MGDYCGDCGAKLTAGVCLECGLPSSTTDESSAINLKVAGAGAGSGFGNDEAWTSIVGGIGGLLILGALLSGFFLIAAVVGIAAEIYHLYQQSENRALKLTVGSLANALKVVLLLLTVAAAYVWGALGFDTNGCYPSAEVYGGLFAALAWSSVLIAVNTDWTKVRHEGRSILFLLIGILPLLVLMGLDGAHHSPFPADHARCVCKDGYCQRGMSYL